jgi:hypothetical protein
MLMLSPIGAVLASCAVVYHTPNAQLTQRRNLLAEISCGSGFELPMSMSNRSNSPLIVHLSSPARPSWRTRPPASHLCSHRWQYRRPARLCLLRSPMRRDSGVGSGRRRGYRGTGSVCIVLVGVSASDVTKPKD